MNADVPFIIICLVILAYLLWRNFLRKEALVEWKIKRTSRKSINEAVDGEVIRISGEVSLAGKKFLTSPILGKKCVGYHTILKEDRSNRSGMSELVNEEEVADFLLTDGKNYALIKTQYVRLAFATWTKDYADKPTAPMRKLLEKYDEVFVKGGLLPFIGYDAVLYYEEACIAEGASVSVSGIANWKPTSELCLSLPVKKVLVISGNEKRPVYLSDEYYLVHRP